MTIYTIGVDADGDVVINPTKVENTAADIKSKISAIKDNDMEITVVSNDNDEKVDAIFVTTRPLLSSPLLTALPFPTSRFCWT